MVRKHTSGGTRTKRLHVDPSELLLEIISIVIAILLAFAVNNWHENSLHDASAREALNEINREIAGNLANLNHVSGHHLVVYRVFRRLSYNAQSTQRLSFDQLFSSRVTAHCCMCPTRPERCSRDSTTNKKSGPTT